MIGDFASLNERVEAGGFRLCFQIYVALVVFVFISLPIALTGLEDNVDGMAGYFGYFLTAAAIILSVLLGVGAAVLRWATGAVRTALTWLLTAILLQAVF